jgi:NAD(P)H-hydrate epimerase
MLLELTADEAQAMDAWLVSRGFALAGLMAAAGEQVAQAARRLLRERGLARAVFLVGPGNNGGDALVAERLLRAETDTLVWRPLPRSAAADALAGADRKPPPRVTSAPPPLDARTLIVDGLFGVGLARPPEGPALAAIEHVNASAACVLAIDVPSGLSADSGEPLGVAIRAQETVSFVLPKRGLLRGAGPAHAGRVLVVEIGFPAREAEDWLRARRAGA